MTGKCIRDGNIVDLLCRFVHGKSAAEYSGGQVDGILEIVFTCSRKLSHSLPYGFFNVYFCCHKCEDLLWIFPIECNGKEICNQILWLQIFLQIQRKKKKNSTHLTHPLAQCFPGPLPISSNVSAYDRCGQSQTAAVTRADPTLLELEESGGPGKHCHGSARWGEYNVFLFKISQGKTARKI